MAIVAYYINQLISTECVGSIIIIKLKSAFVGNKIFDSNQFLFYRDLVVYDVVAVPSSGVLTKMPEKHPTPAWNVSTLNPIPALKEQFFCCLLLVTLPN